MHGVLWLPTTDLSRAAPNPIKNQHGMTKNLELAGILYLSAPNPATE